MSRLWSQLDFRRSCTRAGKLIRKSMEGMIITRIIRTSLECWCRRETRQLNPVILEMRKWGVGPGSRCKGNGQALRKLRTRSMKYKKRDRKKCFPQKRTLQQEFESKQFIWEKTAESTCRRVKSVVPRPASAPPGSLLEMQNLRPHPRLAKSESAFY